MTEQEEFEFRARMEREQAAQSTKVSEPSVPQWLGQQAGNLAAGALRGAGSIGATLLWPIDKATDLIKGDRKQSLSGLITGAAPMSRNEERRKAMDDALASLGAETDSFGYGAGKIGTEIAGTLGAGGAVAQGVGRAAPALASKVPGLLDAVSTAGMRAGGATGAAGVGLRAAGGGIAGGASAALVNPDDGLLGAGIGAALPGVLQVAGKAGRAVGGVVRDMKNRGGTELARALDLRTPADISSVAARLRSASEIVPGSVPTVAQALQTPQAGILQRVVGDSAGGGALRDQLAAQNAARLQALEGVAPIAPGGYTAARQDFGEALSRTAQAERAAANEAIGGMYRAVDPARASRVVLPAPEMQAAADKFLGAGAVGENSMPRTFANEARDLSAPVAAPVDPIMIGSTGPQMVPRGSTWDEVLRMRSSLNEQWVKAKNGGDRQAAAALDAQKRALDNAIEQQLPPDMLNQWREANASRAALGQRFDTGPQADIFRVRNGSPVLQGGEVAAKFWGNRPGLADDVDSFRRLIDDNPRLLGQFRSLITTEGAGAATIDGKLAGKFAKWVDAMKPGIARAFEPDQVRTLERIAEDIKRAESAAGAGMSRGSNTYQNAQNALNLGLLDNPLLNAAANRVPVVNAVSGPALGWMRDTAREAKARRLAGLLGDPRAAAQALDSVTFGGGGLLSNPAFQGLLYRAPPVLAADR